MLSAALPLLVWLAHPHAHANDRKAAPSFASRDQLRACMQAEARLKPQVAEARRTLDENDRLIKAVTDGDAALLAEQAALTGTQDDAAVDAFNRKIEARNARVEELNRKAATAQAALNRLNADLLAHNQRCMSLVYRIADYEAVKRELAGQSRP